MRKGFFASVAALASGAGVALAQGGPGGPMPGPGGYPAWNGPAVPGAVPPGGMMPGTLPPGGMPPGAMPPGSMPPGDPNGFLGGPGGYAGGPPPSDVPPASEMPLNGQVPGPDCPHPINPGAKPKYGKEVGQIHKAAGGPDKWWINVEENVWTIKSMPVPIPLLAIGPAGGNAILGAPGTVPLLGDQNLEHHEWFNVLRISGGWWDCNRCWGIEAVGFVSEQRTQNFDYAFSSQGDTVLARPFIDALTGNPNSLLIASPPTFGGVAHVDTRFHMGGAELNVLKNLMYCDQFKANFLGGFRYVDTTESLDIISTSTLPNPNNGVNPLVSTIGDSFRTHNQFIGGQVGLETELRRGRFFVDMTAKVAAGDMHERLQATGSTVSGTLFGLSNTTTPGGLFVLPTNGGKISRDEFAWVPEGSVNLGYQWTQRISTYTGVNFLYLSRVLRPGDQIDPVVNPNLVPVSSTFGQNFGPRLPEPVIHQSDFWTAGVTFGLSIRY